MPDFHYPVDSRYPSLYGYTLVYSIRIPGRVILHFNSTRHRIVTIIEYIIKLSRIAVGYRQTDNRIYREIVLILYRITYNIIRIR